MFSDDDDDDYIYMDYYESDYSRRYENEYSGRYENNYSRCYESDYSRNTSDDEKSEVSGEVESLLDLSAKVASRCYSFSYVEHIYPHIPEPVAKKFMLWSFPRSRQDLIRHFGCIRNENEAVEDVMQIGFQVSGTYTSERKARDVSLYIDRCVITSASCSCPSNSVPCQHMLALAYYRLKKANTIPIHLPISDSLNPLNREQLLHLVKFIINKHSNVLLLNAQTIANELLDKNSEKNAMPGAPDPTAGGDIDSKPVWVAKKH